MTTLTHKVKQLLQQKGLRLADFKGRVITVADDSGRQIHFAVKAKQPTKRAIKSKKHKKRQAELEPEVVIDLDEEVVVVPVSDPTDPDSVVLPDELTDEQADIPVAVVAEEVQVVEPDLDDDEDDIADDDNLVEKIGVPVAVGAGALLLGGVIWRNFFAPRKFTPFISDRN